MPTPPPPRLLAAAAAGALAGGLLAAFAGGGPGSSAPVATAAGWRPFLAAAGAQAGPDERAIVLLAAPSLADRVRAAGGIASDRQEQRWTAAALAAQDRLLARLRRAGLPLRPERRYLRVVNGLAARLDSRTATRLETVHGVLGVYPVRLAYPASLGEEASLASPPPSGLAGFSGRGVTIALLDTGVARFSPYLHGQVLPGADLVDGGADARPRARPGRPGTQERHGTELAGLLVGQGAPGQPSGLVPQASVLPLRVAGWQRDGFGRWSLHARSDQLLAGLERAVDPDGDGDAHDAARIALVGVAEPGGGFADGPLARAVAGALVLDTLVVAPAGNGGPGAGGAIAGPAGAPSALAVGALDARERLALVPVTVRAGLQVLLRRELPLLSAARPSPGTLELVPAAGATLAAFFGRDGLSRAAGKAVLVPVGPGAGRRMAAAAAAGASLLVLAGTSLPSGGLGLGATTPVVGAPARLALDLRAAALARRPIVVSVGRPRLEANPGRGRLAPFSAHGPGLAGQPKPDLVAPGVDLATAAPGAGLEAPRLVSLHGSSAAAAVAAAAAAQLVQARPELDAAALRSALIGSARPLAGQPRAAQGAGLIDAGRAAWVEVVADPATLAFGRADRPRWRAERRLTIRSLSPRPLTVRLLPGPLPAPGWSLSVRPRRLLLSPGGAASVRVRLGGQAPLDEEVAWGFLRLRPSAGAGLRLPWSVAGEARRPLLAEVELAPRRLRRSTAAPALLSLRLGEAASRLDVELFDARGQQLGLLLRSRHLLSGRHVFALAAQGADGRRLQAGRFRLRLTALSAAGRRATRWITFLVE